MSLARLLPLLLTLAVIGCGSAGQRTQPEKVVTTPPPPKRPATTSAVQIPGGSGHLAAMASRRGFTLRDRPGGRVIAHLKPTSAWGSPTVVWAAEQRGRWLGVFAAKLANNQVGWLDVQRDRPRLWRSPYSLHASLSQRTLELRRGRKLIRRMQIGVGSPTTPTPTGRFSLTDKLIPGRALSYYGCCLLALSGHQPQLRPGWAGGDRIAIHGGQIGGAASAGCLHAGEADLRRLMKLLPIGTPVYITA